MDNNTRLQIKAKTVKKLFAYSGNQCAFQNCSAFLVDDGGTMVGKIAHIRSPKKGGPRYDKNWTSEKCRHQDNLMVLCGPHHDAVDDEDRVDEFPATLLESWKKKHEARFKKAESALIARYADITATIEPKYPKSLRGLAEVYGVEDMVDCQEDIEGIRLFADQLAALPHDARGFALEVTKRMRRLNKTELLASDVLRAFDLTQEDLREIMGLLEEHQLGDVEEDWERGWLIKIANRHPHQIGFPTHCNPFDEIIEYCEATGTDANRFLKDLDFALYDVPPAESREEPSD
ncbi:MAG: hypothetical protein ABNH38_02835 [Tateyamaria sp.]|jgi:hypothetical protein|uniref:hypothetical protein n=1 Tax=Tateyamaria sp. TaxID=1929288 RepID=UPI0032DC5C3F